MTPLLQVITVLASALAGGIISLYLLRLRVKEEARLQHIRRQIEELYGPLFGLIEYGAAIKDIEKERLPPSARDDKGRAKDEEGGKVIRFFREHYYLTLNSQITELIRTKIHLLDSDTIPNSFKEFIRHAAQLDAFHRLWKETNISTHDIKPIKYPEAFKSDVEVTLNKLRREYNQYTRGSETERSRRRRRMAV